MTFHATLALSDGSSGWTPTAIDVYKRQLQGKVVLSGYDNELYNSALQGWHKDSIKTISNMSSPRVECLWLHYNPQLTLF